MKTYHVTVNGLYFVTDGTRTLRFPTGQCTVYLAGPTKKFMLEFLGRIKHPMSMHNFTNYGGFSWGNTMRGITPEIGMWISPLLGNPEDVIRVANADGLLPGVLLREPSAKLP